MANVTFNFTHEIVIGNTVIDSTSFKIIHGIASFLAEFIAFFCYSGFIHYEYYGGDPMKRSLKNKLLAQISKSILTCALTSTPGTN